MIGYARYSSTSMRNGNMEKVIIFGKGNYYQRKKKSVNQKFDIIGFIDNSIKADEEMQVDGLRALNPSQGLKRWDVPVILMSVNFFDMFLQLRAMNAANEIIIGANLHPAYDSFEEFLQERELGIECDESSLVLMGGGKHIVRKANKNGKR